MVRGLNHALLCDFVIRVLAPGQGLLSTRASPHLLARPLMIHLLKSTHFKLMDVFFVP